MVVRIICCSYGQLCGQHSTIALGNTFQGQEASWQGWGGNSLKAPGTKDQAVAPTAA